MVVDIWNVDQSTYMWKKLPTCDQLQRRNIHIQNIENSFYLCGSNLETRNHLFLSCEIASQIWKAIFYWLNVNFVILAEPAQLYEQVDHLNDKKQMEPCDLACNNVEHLERKK